MLNFGVELATAASDLELAQQHAAESVELAEQRATGEDLDAQRNLSIALTKLGDTALELGDPTTAHTHHHAAHTIHQCLAEQLGTARALRDLRSGLTDLAGIADELGNAETAATLRAELATVTDRLAALSEDAPQSPS